MSKAGEQLAGRVVACAAAGLYGRAAPPQADGRGSPCTRCRGAARCRRAAVPPTRMSTEAPSRCQFDDRDLGGRAADAGRAHADPACLRVCPTPKTNSRFWPTSVELDRTPERRARPALGRREARHTAGTSAAAAGMWGGRPSDPRVCGSSARSVRCGHCDSARLMNGGEALQWDLTTAIQRTTGSCAARRRQMLHIIAGASFRLSETR